MYITFVFIIGKESKMVRRFVVAMTFIGVIMFCVGTVTTFAGVCGCPKEGKCVQGCEPGKSNPCTCKH